MLFVWGPSNDGVQKIAEALCAGHAGRREGHGLDQEFWTVNVGFGLGIVSASYSCLWGSG